MATDKLFAPPFFEGFRGYQWRSFWRDLRAGAVVAAFAFPLCLAFGSAVGLGPGAGLITSIVAGFVAALLGGSRIQISGPTAAFIVVVAGIVSAHGQAGLLAATLLAGLLMILFGVLRLGQVLRFLPQPILVGFTAGIAITLIVHSLSGMLGLTAVVARPDLWGDLNAVFQQGNQASFIALAFGISAVLVAYLGERWLPKIPWTLIVVVVGTVVAVVGSLEMPRVGALLGSFSLAPKPFLWNSLSWQSLIDLAPSAFTLAFLGSVESLVSASVADGISAERHRPNTELIGQGLANAASALVGGLPSTGALGRTNVNLRSGGRTPVAAISHSLILGVAALLVAPWINEVPLCVLAGLVVAVALRMTDFREFRLILKAPQSDSLALMTTFFITVCFDLAFAVISGLLVAFFFFVRDMAQNSHTTSSDHQLAEDLPPRCRVLDLNGAFFFGAAGKFDEAIRPLLQSSHTVLLRMDDVTLLDATGTRVLHRIFQDAKALSVRVVMCEVQPQVLRVMEQSELIEALGTKNLFASLEGALRDVRARQPMVFSISVKDGTHDPLY